MSIIIEESDTNFGHNKIIWKGTVSFSKRNNTRTVEKQEIPNQEIPKQDEPLNITSLECNNDYLKIFRYGYGKLNKPNDDNNGPTLSQSLFIPNNIIFTDKGNKSIAFY